MCYSRENMRRKILSLVLIGLIAKSCSTVDIKCPDLYRDHVEESEIIEKLESLLSQNPSKVDKV